jgi:uncharacterized protein YkwD
MACPAAVALALSALGLQGCAEPPPPAAPPRADFYQSLARPGAVVDAAMARAMISAYRQNKGLRPLALDPGLQAAAEGEARAMAAAGRPGSVDAVKGRLRAAGFGRPAANVSAGYHTLPEAFSGWRESAPHDRVLLDPAATRMGIATAYAPGSKYRVYWTLVTAADGPD